MNLFESNSTQLTTFFYASNEVSTIFYTEKVASRLLGCSLLQSNNVPHEISTHDFDTFFSTSHNEDITFDSIIDKNNLPNRKFIILYRNPIKKLLSGLSQDLFILLFNKELDTTLSNFKKDFWNSFDTKTDIDIFTEFVNQSNPIQSGQYDEIIQTILQSENQSIHEIFKSICHQWIYFFIDRFPINYNHSNYWCYAVNELISKLENFKENIILYDIDSQPFTNLDYLLEKYNLKGESMDYLEFSNNKVKGIFIEKINKDLKLQDKIKILLRLDMFFYEKLTKSKYNFLI